MKLSTKGRYGLRAIIDIAEYGEAVPVSISAVSKRQGITVRYLEQLLPKLRKAGFIQSIRGAQGGYVMAKETNQISVGDILRALEGDLFLVDCYEVTGEGEQCQGARFCVTKTVWKKINDSIKDTVDNMYLSDLVEEAKSVHQSESKERKDYE
ncbi:MAG: Rrf2 family transcriptional regulator [Anaerostipes sp.]|nr:Rrf2 family transcriptional regulator [Anaerostipes sp.]